MGRFGLAPDNGGRMSGNKPFLLTFTWGRMAFAIGSQKGKPMGAVLKLYQSDRTLDELAELIRQNEQNINFPLRTSLKAAAQSGAWACEAKSKVKHGEWEAWVKSLGKPAPSTLRRYMQIFKDPKRADKVNTIKDFTRFVVDGVDKAVRKEIRFDEIEKAKMLLAQGR